VPIPPSRICSSAAASPGSRSPHLPFTGTVHGDGSRACGRQELAQADIVQTRPDQARVRQSNAYYRIDGFGGGLEHKVDVVGNLSPFQRRAATSALVPLVADSMTA
jgi:hypothetical protein